MPDIMVVLACLSQCVPPTPLRQLGRLIEALLSIRGRVTMKGLSRWSSQGGSYRTIQRLFTTPLDWLQLNWLLIRHHLWDGDEVALGTNPLDPHDRPVTQAYSAVVSYKNHFP